MNKDEPIQPSAVFLELRHRLLVPIIVFFLGLTFGIIFNRQILLFILSLFNLSGINVVLTSSYQVFELAFNVGITVGLFVFFPVFLYEIYGFTKPAMRKKERNLVKKIIPLSLTLFFIGFALGVKMTQYIFTLLSQTSSDFNVGNYLDISSVISQVLIMGLLTGVVFQIPLIFTALIKMKIVTRQALAKRRKIVWAALIIIAMLLPSTDILSLILLALPLLLLFEFTLLLNR
jgi:sec-independent protein translocase protein TatC